MVTPTMKVKKKALQATLYLHIILSIVRNLWHSQQNTSDIKELVGDTDLIPMAVKLNREYLINKYFISNDLQEFMIHSQQQLH